MKILYLSFVLLFLSPQNYPTRVVFVNSPLDADLIINESKEKIDSDMVIFLTIDKSQTGNATWMKVQPHENPDKKVYISSNEGIKVYFTENKFESRLNQ